MFSINDHRESFFNSSAIFPPVSVFFEKSISISKTYFLLYSDVINDIVGFFI